MQSCSNKCHVYRRIEQLESSSQSEVATLPVSTNTGTITNGLGVRTASNTSLDGSSNSLHVTLLPRNNRLSPDEVSTGQYWALHYKIEDG